ncbi:MAG: polymer-forming cytoskeletal protein [Desulfofustis sp.]|jgi:cytoskeletal protein CcmA (bactofilin family)
MFKNKDNLEKQIQKVESETISSIVDHNMTINGELSFKGKTRIDGTVTGNITGEHLILSQSGTIAGDICVTSFVCHGSIEGSVNADLVTARKGSSISGRVTAANLVVEPGAALDGEVKTVSEPPAIVELSPETKKIQG